MMNTEIPASATTSLDRQTFTIGVLVLTAAVLLVGLLATPGRPQRAFAIGQNASGGDFLMLTQQLTNSQEALVVIDAAADRMIVYGFDFSRRTLLPIDGFDLKNLQKRGAPAAAPPPGGSRR